MNRNAKVTRRQTVAMLAATFAAPAVGSGARAQGTGKLMLVNWGGSIAATKTKVFYEPFTRETGIEIVQANGPDLAKLRVQVQSGNLEWDIVDGALASWVPTAEQYNLFEPIDKTIVPIDKIDKYALRPSLIGTYYFSSGIIAPTDRIPEAGRPKSWADFWDVKSFPGRRGLFNRVGETIEFALMADGVKPKDIYPCDVERAFKALDRIKPHIANWYTTSAQSVNLVMRNECDFTYGYASWVNNAVADGAKLSLSKDYNLIGVNWVGIPRGIRNKAAAMKFLEFSLRPDRQAEFANAVKYAPVVQAALPQIQSEVRALLPDVNSPNNCVLNLDWWAGKEENLNQRFKSWLLA